MPPFLLFLLRHALIGFGISALFVAGVVWADPSGVGTLLLSSREHPLPLALLWFFSDGMTLDAAPRPADPAVVLRAAPAMNVGVLRFSGVATADRVAGAQARLVAALALSPWEALGEGGAWFHDPPWTIPSLRRNEAWVEVRRRQPFPV